MIPLSKIVLLNTIHAATCFLTIFYKLILTLKNIDEYNFLYAQSFLLSGKT